MAYEDMRPRRDMRREKPKHRQQGPPPPPPERPEERPPQETESEAPVFTLPRQALAEGGGAKVGEEVVFEVVAADGESVSLRYATADRGKGRPGKYPPPPGADRMGSAAEGFMGRYHKAMSEGKGE